MSWTESDKQFVSENIGKMGFDAMAEHLGKTKNAVHLYLHRRRIPYKPQVKVNLVLEILKLAFRRPDYFHPTKEFFTEIGMTQMRFWSLYRGETHPTEDEYEKLKKHFGVKSETVFENRQLKLFENMGGGVKRKSKTQTH